MINRYIRGKLGIRGESLPYVGRGPNTREKLLPELFSELGYKVGAEIGVSRGVFSRLFLEKIEGLKMYCVDPWTPYRNVPRQHRQDRAQSAARSHLKDFNVEFIVKTSHDALPDIADGSLDFVYIDGLHDFDNVMFDIIEWSRKVRRNGIVAGHDYFFHPATGVVFAVEAYVRAHNIQQWYLTKEGYPTPPSWFWVRP